MSCDCKKSFHCQIINKIGDRLNKERQIRKQRRQKGQQLLFICTDLMRRPRAKHIVDAAVALRLMGHKITFVTTTASNGLYGVDMMQFRIMEIGKWIPSKIVGSFKTSLYFIRSLYIALWLSIALKQMHPKPVILFVEATHITVPVLKMLTDCKIIYFQYEFDLCRLYKPASKLKLQSKWLWKQCLLNADEILVPNRIFYNIYRRSFGCGSRILPIVCQPYVDVHLLNRKQSAQVQNIVPSLNDNYFTYLVLGEYNERANFELAIEAFYLLIHNVKHGLHKRMRLLFSGHCGKHRQEQRQYYRKMRLKVKDLKLNGHVIFTRRFGRDYKKALMMHAIAIIDPIVDGLFNRYLLEAMALGRPIIATETGFAREALYHGVTGLLMPATAEHFALAMNEIVSNPSKIKFMCNMAHDEFVRTYSLEAYGHRLNQLIIKHSAYINCKQ